MKITFVLFCYLAYVNATSFKEVVLEEWETWKVEHGKEYKNKLEDNFRMKVFMDNKARIAKHNALAHQGQKTYTMKLNEYADMLHQEFITTMMGYDQSNKNTSNVGLTQIYPANVDLPDHMDWRDHGAVTGVKNQGTCGSCWAFSTTGALEGQHFRKTGKLVSLSEQNLIDCSRKFGNKGCLGGLMDSAFTFIKENDGIDTEASYPYRDIKADQYNPKSHSCHFNKHTVGATDKGFVDITQFDEDALKAAVATIGPISVAIDAKHDSFMFYHGGIFYEPTCHSLILNHGVLVVGYGTSEQGDYWLVKNSWGKTYGEEGYIKMARNKNNNCGIATEASYPTV